MALGKNLEKIQVKMLGQFSIRCGDVAFSDTVGRTKQVWMLLEYLILNRKREVSQEELISILWETGNSENPSNALKNLVYRLRTMLAQSDLPSLDYILYKRGAYSWNSEIPCQVDVEFLEEYWSQAEKPEASEEERLEACWKAIELYEGRFLPKSSYEQWVASLSSYYHQIYLNSIWVICPLLESRRRYKQIVQICRKAVAIDEYEETLYEILINALIQLGDHKEALKQYEHITDKLYRDLAVNPTCRIRDLYRQIISAIKGVERDILVIKEDLQETDQAMGAYFCEYEVFKSMYQVMARRVQRTGQSGYILLFTLTDTENEIPQPKVLNRAIGLLQTAIGDSLRKGDIYARFSNSQYVVMLTSINYENCEVVSRRIETRFYLLMRNKKVLLHKKMHPMDTILS